MRVVDVLAHFRLTVVCGEENRCRRTCFGIEACHASINYRLDARRLKRRTRGQDILEQSIGQLFHNLGIGATQDHIVARAASDDDFVVDMNEDAVVSFATINGDHTYVGPALPLIVALIGWDIYGLGGAIYGVLLLILALAFADAFGVESGEAQSTTSDTSPVGKPA